MNNKKTKIVFLLIFLLGFLLRIYNLSNNPPSLYWDEVSLGYNAYSILKTAKDEHGEFLPISRFVAFGDYKPPGYIYALVPSIFLFGLTEFSVRFPSVIAGLGLVIITYYLAYDFFRKKKIAFLAMFLIAVSSWSIQLSRAAFEANLASFFNAIAVFCFLKVKKGRGYLLFLSVIFFVLSFYTFNANRIIAPLLLLFFVIYKRAEVIREKKWLIISFIIGLIMIIPSLNYLNSRESKIRFQEVSILTNLQPLELSNQRITLHDNSLVGRIIHNRRIVYSLEFLNHFLDHFKGDFLFISGDRNPRLSTQETGELYLFSLPFLLIGIFLTIKNLQKAALPLFVWIILAIIPAAVSKETPHMLRTASVLPVYQLFIGFGIWKFLEYFKKKNLVNYLYFIVPVLLAVNIYYYLHMYYIHYPYEWAGEWQYGYKQAVLTVKEIENDYDYIAVTQGLGRPYINFLFWGQVDPEFYQQTRIASRDWFGFWTISGFGKYRFGLDKLDKLTGKILIVGTDSETKYLTNVIKTITGPRGNIVFRIGTN